MFIGSKPTGLLLATRIVLRIFGLPTRVMRHPNVLYCDWVNALRGILDEAAMCMKVTYK